METLICVQYFSISLKQSKDDTLYVHLMLTYSAHSLTWFQHSITWYNPRCMELRRLYHEWWPFLHGGELCKFSRMRPHCHLEYARLVKVIERWLSIGVLGLASKLRLKTTPAMNQTKPLNGTTWTNSLSSRCSDSRTRSAPAPALCIDLPPC